MSPKKKQSRIVDAHAHPDWHGHDFERFVANMDEHGIEKSWLLTWEAPSDECEPAYNSVLPGALLGPGGPPVPFSRCLAYGERAPDRFILGYAPDPRRPDAVDLLKAAIDIYNVRVCGEVKFRMMYDNPDALRLFRFCGERALPVIVHIDYEFDSGSNYPRPNYWYGGGIEAFDRAVTACPETAFLGHGPGFWAHISGDDKWKKEPYPKGRVIKGGKIIEMLARCPNLYCDLSAASALNAMKRSRKFARDLIEASPTRFLFGRDSFDDRLRKFLDSIGLSRSTLDAVYSGNAKRLVPDS